MDSVAVASPCVQKEWEEWKREMGDNQRRRWGDRVNCWAEGAEDEENEEEKDDGEEEGEDKECREYCENEEEKEFKEWKKEMKVKKYEEIEDEEEEYETQRGKIENKTVDETSNEVDEQIGLVDEEKEKESEVKEKAAEKEDKEKMASQVGEEEEEDEVQWEFMRNEEVPHHLLSLEEEGEVPSHFVPLNPLPHHLLADKGEVNNLKALTEEEEKFEIKDNYKEEGEEMKDNGVLDGEEMQEGLEIKHELEGEIKEEMDEFHEKDEEIDNRDEDNQGQDQPRQCHMEEQLTDLMTTAEDKNIQRNAESKAEEGAAVFKDSDSVETVDNQDPGSMGYKDTSQTTQEEEFQENDTRLQEEYTESTDDEAAEEDDDDDDDGENESIIKIYTKDHYATDIFNTLTEFRESSLLTDLTLSTENQTFYHVHSPVMAAVSSFIWGHLTKRNKQANADTSVGVQRWSVFLGPEVDDIGLEAVVEFAYTGIIPRLNEETVEQIRTAAQTLGVPRVLRLCTQQNFLKTGGQKNSSEQKIITLQSIYQQWIDIVGCDVTLKALKGESIHVHRVILAASSDYFRAMFTSGMKESYESHVKLPFLMAPDLEVLISCSYSGVLPLSWKCVFETTSTALQLQYQPALSLCLRFLQQEMNPYYCLDVASFAEAYEIVNLLQIADDFVSRQFQKVARTSKFKDLPARQLLRYLNSHSLCVPSELVVFKAVVAWIQAKPKRRLKLAKDLMKTIHFPLMTFKEFKEVQSLNIWSDHNLAELYDAVFQEFCSNDTITQIQCRIYLPKDSVVLIGGDQISEDLGSRSISRELWFGNSLRNHTGIKKAMEWRKLGEMPEPARFSHEVAVLQGKLYVFGGKKYYGISDTLSSVYRYDPLQNQWENLAEMQEKRCSFSVVVLDDKIYALGGYCDPEYIESVEQYCPTANSWSFTWPLDFPLSGHVAKVLHGKIFATGGQNSDHQAIASLFLYHPETGSTHLPNMITPRAHHCMEALGECLYVAGGITTDDNTTAVDQLTCEVYSPAANSWTVFASLPVPHVGAASTVLEGKFYVLGGYSQEDYTDTKMVHRYDPNLQRWENMGKMPGPNNDIRAALLCLPTHLRL